MYILTGNSTNVQVVSIFPFYLFSKLLRNLRAAKISSGENHRAVYHRNPHNKWDGIVSKHFSFQVSKTNFRSLAYQNILYLSLLFPLVLYPCYGKQCSCDVIVFQKTKQFHFLRGFSFIRGKTL